MAGPNCFSKGPASARARILVLLLVLLAIAGCSRASGEQPAATATGATTSSTGDVATSTTAGPFDVAGTRDRSATWSVELSANPTRPVVAGDGVLVGDDSGLLQAIEPDGTTRWERQLSTSDDLTDVWQPAVVDDVVVTGVSIKEGSVKDGTAIGLDLATGAVRWRSSLDGRPVLNTLAFHDVRQGMLTDGVLAFVELTGFVYAIDPASGATRWEKEIPRSLGSTESMHVAGDLVFATSATSTAVSTVAYDSADGSERWRTEDLRAFALAGTGDVVVVEGSATRSISDGRSLVGLDAATGEELWSVPLGDEERLLGIAATADIVVRQTADRLIAYRPGAGDAPAWEADLDLDAPGALPVFSTPPVFLDDTIVVAAYANVHLEPDPAFVLSYDLSGSPLVQWEEAGIPVGVAAAAAGRVFVTLAADGGAEAAPPTVIALDLGQAPGPGLAAENSGSVLLGIPSPGEAITAANVGLAALLLLAIMVLVVVPTTLFDYALEARLDDLRTRLPWNRRRIEGGAPTPTTTWRRWRGLVVYTALAAVIYSFLQTGWGPNAATVITVVSFWAALGAITVLEIAAIWLYQAVRYRPAPCAPMLNSARWASRRSASPVPG